MQGVLHVILTMAAVYFNQLNLITHWKFDLQYKKKAGYA